MEWYPNKVLSGIEPFALLILNQPLQDQEKQFVEKKWNSALFHVAVDGGANQLKELSNENFSPIPDLICGDFDSATPEVLDYYRKKGARVIETEDQDETDFTKALRLTDTLLKEGNIKVSFIVAVIRHGDRLDHILGNLNTLYTADTITSLPIYILGHKSLTWNLLPGHHKIHITNEIMDSHVGLLPLGCECTDVTTTGLKWNMNHGKMKFGGLISICNKFDGSEWVTVSNDTPLIWTMEMKSSYI